MTKTWAPSSLEEKCLQHLDAPDNWQILRTQRPNESVILGWKPFWRIFAINFVLFLIVFALLFVALEVSFGAGIADAREDLPYGAVATFLFAGGFGFYVMHLYRRTWNRRARLLRQLAAEDNLN